MRNHSCWLPRLAAFLLYFTCAGILSGTRPPAQSPDAWGKAVHLNNAGIAHMNRNEYKLARACFRSALRLAPQYLNAEVNLGIAQFAGNHDTLAAGVLQQVLRAHPAELHALFVLGLIEQNHGKFAAAGRYFQAVLRRAPRNPYANYFYGFALFHEGQFRPAILYYRRTLRSMPDNISALFGVANAYRQLNQPRLAMVYMRRFLELRKDKLNKPIGVIYGEQGPLAKVMGRLPEQVVYTPHAALVRYVNVTAQTGIAFKNLAKNPSRFAGSGACVIDEGHPERPDLLFLNDHAPPAYFQNSGNGKFKNISAKIGFTQPLTGLGCAVGDFDNSGRPTIAISTPRRILLFQLNPAGKYADITARAGIAAPGPFLGLAFIDLFHNGFLDLVASNGAPGGHITVFRNLATGKFVLDSTRSGIGQTAGAYSGILGTDYNNDRAVDVALTRQDGAPELARNNRNGTFTTVTPWTGDPAPDARGVMALDYLQNGRMDLFFTRKNGPPVLLQNLGNNHFRPVPLPAVNSTIHSAWGATALDYDNSGLMDIAFIGKSRGAEHIYLYKNLGNGTFADVSAAVGLANINLHHGRTLLAADLFNDGADSLIATQAGGPALILRGIFPGQGAQKNHALLLASRGLKDNKTGIGNKIWLQAGPLRQKVEVEGGSGYLGQNPSAQLLGMGPYRKPDYVRILWPTGVDQYEFPGAVHVATIGELNRKGGSCPMLYVWNGRRFHFLDDIIGPGVIGEWTGRSQYDTPAPSEYFKIPAGELAPRAGHYSFRFTDQMEEVVYLDKIRLIAIDHPAGTRVFTNGRYQPAGQPAPFHVWQVRHLRSPIAVTNGHGQNVFSYLQRRRYIPIKARAPYPGYAGTHELTINLGNLRHAKSALLLLHGWTDYYFPDQEWTARHAGIRDLPPQLQIPNGRGGWKTVIASMGAPAGLPRTIAVNLTPYLRQFSAGDARVRIRTNLAIYWNRIQVGSIAAAPLRITRLRAVYANLNHLGYPRQVSNHPARYDYSRILQNIGYRIVSGNYTRYGSVLPLLRHNDNRYVIMASGDQIALRFAMSTLPRLRKGWKRSFFFYADGFTKGDDFLDARPNHVGPLPLHGVPYPTPAGAPISPQVAAYRLRYNTRHIQ